MSDYIKTPCPNCGAELALLLIDVTSGGYDGAVCVKCGYNPAGLSQEALSDIKEFFEEEPE